MSGEDFRPGLPDFGTPAEPVQVRALNVFPGVWVHASGTTPAGEPVAVAGAVLRDPRDLGHAVALLVRDYRARRDVTVLVAAYPEDETTMERLHRLEAQRSGLGEAYDAFVQLVDDPDDFAGRAEHAAEPAFTGSPVERVTLLRRPAGVTSNDFRLWDREEHDTPLTYDELTALVAEVAADSDLHLSAVHWGT